MNSNNNILKLAVAASLVFGLSFGAMAAPDIYLTKAGSVTLNFASAVGYTLQAGDKVMWQAFDDTDAPIGTLIEKTYAASIADVALSLSGATEITDLGEHYYKAFIVTADPARCGGDLSDVIEIYRLPDLNVALAASIAEYCAENSADVGGAVESVFTGTTTTEAGSSLPGDILLTYAWAAEKDAAPVADLSVIGAASTSPTTSLTSTFTLTTAVTGKYDFIASVEYALESNSGIKIKGGSLVSSAAATVDVTPKPGKPSITIE